MNSDMLVMALAVVISGFIVFVLTLLFAAIHNAAPQTQRLYTGSDYTVYASNEPVSPGATLLLRLIALPLLLLLGSLLAYVLMQST